MVPSDLRSRAARLCRLRHDPQLLFPAPAPPPLNRRDHLDCRHRAMPIVTISIALGAHSAEKQGSHQTTLTKVQAIEDLQLREQPDPRARNILGVPPDDRMPKGSQVALIDICRTWMGSGRGAQDADNIWCPVLYEGHRGWALAGHHGE